MGWRTFNRLTAVAFLILGVYASQPATARAQNTNGVLVDAEGVLRKQSFADPNGSLQRQRAISARAQLDKKVASPSQLRKVSLNRLEEAMKTAITEHGGPTDAMLHLAGLTRVKYVFYYPDTKDIVLAGPAEGWVNDLSGRVVGLETGRPVLELQDLIVALRAFPPGTKKAPVLLCSIDPTKEGLAKYREVLKGIGSQISGPGDAPMIVSSLRNAMGMQNIRVGGVSASTHFAQVMIEADYRMKLIGLGMERPPIRLASYVDKADLASISANAMQRWYFVPDYQCVRVTGDELGMELVGDGVKLVGEDQVIREDGSRVTAARVNKASELFVTAFTSKYAELAAKVPVYAQLRNLIDLAVAAAFIQQHDYYGKAGWNAEAFGSENAYKVETYQTPMYVETTVGSVVKGGRLATPTGGGVHIQPRTALEAGNLLKDEHGKVTSTREAIRIKDLPPGQWWWD